jgi:hypothetical protein
MHRDGSTSGRADTRGERIEDALARGIDRKRFLAGLLGVPAWIAVGGCSPTEAPAGASASGEGEEPARDDRGAASGGAGEALEERVERILREYDAHGIHRTATEGDVRSAQWLLEEAKRHTPNAELETVPFSRIDVVECFVEVAGQRLEGVPLFDAPFTGPEGIRGRLGPLNDAGTTIGWGEVSPSADGGPGFIDHRRATTQKALVLATGGARFDLPPGLALLNAAGYREPYGPPGVQLSSETRDVLAGAAGSEVRVVVHATRADVEAHNVLARVEGRDAALAPLVIMTPRSGWWHCASERGGGIATWVEMLASLAAAAPARTVHFVASTGHELGHFGLEHYLESRQELVRTAHAWIHLGANFVTTKRPRVMMQFSDQAMRDLAVSVLKRHRVAPDAERPIGEQPIGEVANVADRARYISILGQSGVFHHPDDRFPEAVSVPRAISFAHGFVEIAQALVRDEGAAASG